MPAAPASAVPPTLTLLRLRVERQQEHSYLASALGPGSVVVDLGLHHGHFAHAMVHEHGCRVYGLEPVRQSYDHATRVEGLIADCAAIAEHDGTIELTLDPKHGATVHAALAPNAGETVSAEAISLASFMARHDLGEVDLLKMDVEGAELAVLGNAPASVLNHIAQISVEFHDSLDVSLAADVCRVTRRLSELGFSTLRFSRTTDDVLFVNRSRIPLSRAGTGWLLLRYKYLRGLLRAGKRLAQRA